MAVHYWSVVYLFLLQVVIPTLKSHAATPRHVTTRTCPLWTNISRRFSIFRPCFRVPVSCLFLCCCRSFTPATVSPIRRESLLIFVFLAKIRQDLTSIISPFALFRAFCVVVEFHSSHSFAHFSVIFCRFWRHIYSPFALFRACCVVVEFHSSHSFVNYSSFLYAYCENSTGFDV
jgi:hypothetical protein